MSQGLKLLTWSASGGLIAILGGFCWRAIEAAHNLKFVGELASDRSLANAVQQFSHPPILMLGLGMVFALIAELLRRRRSRSCSRVCEHEIAREIEAALQTSDDVYVQIDKHAAGHTLILKKQAASRSKSTNVIVDATMLDN